MRLRISMFSCRAVACTVAWTLVAGGALAQQSTQQGQETQRNQLGQQERSDQQGRSFDDRSQSNQQSAQQPRDQRRMQSDMQKDRRFQTDQMDRRSSTQREGQDQYRQTDRMDSLRDSNRMQHDDQRGGSPPAGLGVSVVDGNRGVRVQRIAPDSPAESAGIRVGDEIVSVNGRQIRDGEQLVYIVQDEDPGASVDIELIRDGRIQQVSADLERRGEVFSDAQTQQRRGYRSDYLDSPPWGDDELRRHIESLEQTVEQMQREIRDLRTMLDNDPSGTSYSSSPSQPNRQTGTSTARGYSNEYQQPDSRQFDQRSSRELDSNRNFDANRGFSSDRSQRDDRNRSQSDDRNRSRSDDLNRSQSDDLNRSQSDDLNRSQRDQDNRDRNDR